MIMPIRYYGDPVLRRPARPVTDFDAALARLAEDMIETMRDANGVGLAAPQVGVSSRMFVAAEYETGEDDEPRLVAEHVLVNPEILELDGSQVVQEGCLSVPGLYLDELERAQSVRFRYQDLRGEWAERTAHGHFAQVIQHENDHLDGIMYFDRLPPAQRRAFMERHRAELAELQREAKAFLRGLREAGQLR